MRKILIGIAALLALNAVLFVAAPSAALPASLASYFYGPKMVRAEVVVKDSGIRDYRLDRGKVRSDGNSLTLVEADNTVVVVPVAPSAQITLNGANVPLSSLRRGHKVLTVRNGETGAQVVRATRR